MEDVQSSVATPSVLDVKTRPGTAETLEQSVLRAQTLYAIAAGLAVAFTLILANSGRDLVPISGDNASFGMIMVLANIPVALVGTGLGIVRGVGQWNHRVGENRRLKWWWSLIPVSLAYTVLSTALLLGGIAAFEYAFEGLMIDRFQAAILSGAVVAMFAYMFVGNALRLNTKRLLTITILVMVMGLYLGAVITADRQWWLHSFSYLGERGSNVGWLFNGTLVYLGILVFVWSAYYMNDYRLLVRHGVASSKAVPWIRGCILWIGVAAALIAFFRWQSTPFNSNVHLFATATLSVVLAGLMIASRWIVPSFPPSYFILTFIMMLLIVLVQVAAQFGKMNTVGVEFFSFGIGLSWLTQFAANTSSLGRQLEPEAFPF